MTNPKVQEQSTFDEIPFLLLVGGLGTRLGENAQGQPKTLVDVAGEPFLAHLLRLLRREGVKRVILLTHHLEEKIRAYVKDGSNFGLSVVYSADEQDSLGTGAAIAKALPFVQTNFAVMYGDSYLDISMRPVYETFERLGASGLMTILENRNQWQPSNVEFDIQSEKVLKYDKTLKDENMHYIDYGLSFFSRQAFEKHLIKRDENTFDLGCIFQSMVKDSSLSGYPVSQRFYDVTNLESLIETRAYLSQNQLWQIDSADQAL